MKTTGRVARAVAFLVTGGPPFWALSPGPAERTQAGARDARGPYDVPIAAAGEEESKVGQTRPPGLQAVREE